MFGYACDETPELMPPPIMLRAPAGQAAGRASARRARSTCCAPTARARSPSSTRRRPPEAHRHRRASRRSTRRRQAQGSSRGRDGARSSRRSCPTKLLDKKTKYFVNPTGRFVVGGRSATPASPVARSSSTPTAAWAVTAAAPSAARTRPRSIARRATSRATSRRTSSPPGSPRAARCRSRTPSASRKPVGVYVTHVRHRQGRRREARQGYVAELRLPPQRADRGARPAAPDLPPDRGLRPLRPHREEFTWEATDRAQELADELFPRRARTVSMARPTSARAAPRARAKKPSSRASELSCAVADEELVASFSSCLCLSTEAVCRCFPAAAAVRVRSHRTPRRLGVASRLRGLRCWVRCAGCDRAGCVRCRRVVAET